MVQDVTQELTKEQWVEFRERGFVKIGQTMTELETLALRNQAHALMTGNVRHEKLFMQLDPGADATYDSLTSHSSDPKFDKESLAYRKIGEAGCGLELDPLFKAFMSKDIFEKIARRVYGSHVPVSVYRATLFSKPSSQDGGGQVLPWHQDGGLHWALDRDPRYFVWTALCKVTKEKGAVQVVPGSHKDGLCSEVGHLLSNEAVDHFVDETVEYLTCEPGESYLCDNFIVHRSGVNTTDSPRLGLTINYCDGRTKVLDPKPKASDPLTKAGMSFPQIFPARCKFATGCPGWNMQEDFYKVGESDTQSGEKDTKARRSKSGKKKGKHGKKSKAA